MRRTRIIAKGMYKMTGPEQLVLPPKPEQLAAALERMRKVQHVNRRIVEEDGVETLAELLYLENARDGERYEDYLRRNGINLEYLPRERQSA